jgi:hypothetical protein
MVIFKRFNLSIKISFGKNCYDMVKIVFNLSQLRQLVSGFPLRQPALSQVSHVGFLVGKLAL